MPWWLLGVSMVATTFSTDTPNLVTDIVRTNGVSGNWVWWAFLLTGLLTVFVYAKLWRKSNVNTDLEFYQIRYGGASAKFLRKFRAIYLGIFSLLILLMIYAVIKKIIKLAFFISIFFVMYIVYLNYTNQVVPKNIDELKKNVVKNVDKLKSTASESINQVKSSTKKAIEEEIDKKLDKILDK